MPSVIITAVKFIKKPSTVQVIGHKNQALISLETQKKKKRIWKIDFGTARICMEIINPRTKGTHTSTQTTVVYMILIQKKKPSVTQRTHGSDTSQKKLKKQQKATQELKVFQKLKLQSQRFQK